MNYTNKSSYFNINKKFHFITPARFKKMEFDENVPHQIRYFGKNDVDMECAECHGKSVGILEAWTRNICGPPTDGTESKYVCYCNVCDLYTYKGHEESEFVVD